MNEPMVPVHTDKIRDYFQAKADRGEMTREEAGRMADGLCTPVADESIIAGQVDADTTAVCPTEGDVVTEYLRQILHGG